MIEIKIKKSTDGFRVLSMEEDYTEVFHGYVSEPREILGRVHQFLCKSMGLIDMGEEGILTRAEYFKLFGKLPEGSIG